MVKDFQSPVNSFTRTQGYNADYDLCDGDNKYDLRRYHLLNWKNVLFESSVSFRQDTGKTQTITN
jgi:hypothetical protein